MFSDIDDCLHNNCISEQTDGCVDGVGAYTCDCVRGYDGDQCQNSKNV